MTEAKRPRACLRAACAQALALLLAGASPSAALASAPGPGALDDAAVCMERPSAEEPEAPDAEEPSEAGIEASEPAAPSGSVEAPDPVATFALQSPGCSQFGAEGSPLAPSAERLALSGSSPSPFQAPFLGAAAVFAAASAALAFGGMRLVRAPCPRASYHHDRTRGETCPKPKRRPPSRSTTS